MANFTLAQESTLGHTGSLWFLKFGVFPKKGLCHKCDNPVCIRWSHLFEGTQHDNILDAVKKNRWANTKKTHCLSGHLLFGENLFIPLTGGRVCRECSRAKTRARRRFIKKGEKMYASENFQTKKALKEAVAAGKKITVFAPGLGTPKTDGKEYIEGPHYPQPHKWYAEVEMKNGFITKVS